MIAFFGPRPRRLHASRETRRRFGIWDNYGRYYGRLHRDGRGWRLERPGREELRTISHHTYRQALDWALETCAEDAHG